MLQTLKYFFTVLLIVLITSGCEEKTDWDFHPEENGALVVEAILTNEIKNQEVILSLSYDTPNGEPIPVADAQVLVRGDGVIYNFQTASIQPGKYISELPFATQLGIPYTLEILWNGSNYLAENEMIEVIPFAPLTFKPFGQTDSVQIREVAPLYSPNEQAMYEVDIDWRHITGSDSSRAKLFFYTFNTIDVNELFRPEQENVPFPKGSIVIEKKYSLNPEFAAYFRALLMENEWQGGVFDEASASLPTNLNNGALGFFGVSAVLCDTLIAE